MALAPYEELARELSTFTDRQAELSTLIASIRNNSISKQDLIEELKKAKLTYFANKVADEYYILNPLEEEEKDNG